MSPFTYTKPEQAAEAVREISSNSNAKFIGGGTNLLDLMKENIIRPSRLIDLNGLPFAGIERLEAGGLRLGALATNAETAYHPEVVQHYPLLSKAILAGASAQLRNMATNGGNLLQRTRCYYFYDSATPCNKREPGSGCPAVAGYNRIHAVLGTSEHCIATHPSDFCVALAALEATVLVRGPQGERTLPFSEFHRLPGDKPQQDNTLQTNELIVAIDLPSEGYAKRHTYLKLRDRASYAFALVSVAVGLQVEGDQIKHGRIALGGVAHKPWRDEDAESLLVGQTPSRELFQKVADRIMATAHGYGSNNFKIELGRRAIVRALTEAEQNSR